MGSAGIEKQKEQRMKKNLYSPGFSSR